MQERTVARVASRWPSVSHLDEHRKCRPCTAEAQDTCWSRRSSLFTFRAVFLSPRSPMRVWPPLKRPHLISGAEEPQEGGKTLSLMSFSSFLLAIQGGRGGSDSSILETQEGPCLDPYIAWQGHEVMGGRHCGGNFPCVWVYLF